MTYNGHHMVPSMKNMDGSSNTRVLYLPHGGGPMPLLGDPGHASMVEFLRDFGALGRKPSAVLLISAHWEAPQPTIISNANPGLYYDYSGFPPAAYDLDYPAPGEPELAQQVHRFLSDAALNPAMESERGFDHGVFVPLILMYPKADIPIVQMSLVRGLDPQRHIDIGRALSSLDWEGLLIVGSGMSFHNQRAMMSPDATMHAKGEQFHEWLHETCARPGLTEGERIARLVHWETAPYGRFCHPREEHLMPLHVCCGAAAAIAPYAQVVYHDNIMKTKVSGLLWQ